MTITLAAAAAMLISGAAAAEGPPAKAPPKAPLGKRECFLASNVTNFAAADEKTVYVRVGVQDVYQFDMFGRCPDIDWNQRLALVSRTSSWICDGMDADVITHTPLGPQRCPVRSIRKLTPAEVKALPKRAQP
jgi:hypothetical protein